MKTSYKYLAIAFTTLLCSCNEGIAPDMIESQVQISANITSCVLTRVTEDGTSFTDGDAIQVQNMDRESKNIATYTYSESTGMWNTSDELYWDGEAANTFNAWYPTSASYGSFTIPADQTSGIADSDWMTATVSAKKADGTINLSFNHNLAKVTVTIESWSNEYSANEKTANSLEISSLSSVMSYDGTLSGDNVAKKIKAYVTQPNTSFVAIIAPATYATGDNIMQVYVNDSSTPLVVKTSYALTLESGKAYRFKLAIGKNLAEITSSVTIGGWDDVTLDDQQMTVETIKKIDYVDEYGINHGEGVEIDGVVWAPVNCGYHAEDFKYGKLYQWGRKYGQGYNGDFYIDYELNGTYSDSSFPIIEEGPVTLEIGQAANNANIYYDVKAEPYNWLTAHDPLLWNEGTEDSPIKSQYDPCPAGWRVPTYIEMKDLISNSSEWIEDTNGQKGYWFSGTSEYISTSSSIFLPAAGFINSNPMWRGRAGTYWTSKSDFVSRHYSYWLTISPTSIQYNGSDFYIGSSVRCVQDLEYTSEPPVVEPVENAYIDEAGTNHGAGIEIDGIIWAPVNCGYHETDYPYGKLYQWGRKYGQGHGKEYNEPEPEYYEGGGYHDTEEWSNVFYTRNYDITHHTASEADFAISGIQQTYALPIDWTNSSNDKFWNSATEFSPQKTEHDPCPIGWRVPTYTELIHMEDLQALPTIGSRNYDGLLNENDTYYWSSTPSSRQISWCSTINSLNDIAYSSQREAYRVNGYYVRCVKE